MERGAAIALYYRHGSRHPVLDRTCDRHVRFWTTRITELQNITEDAARTATQYPLTLYPKWMSSILLIVVPVGLVNYIPSLYILRGELGVWVARIGWSGSGMSLLKSEILAVWFDQISKYRS